MMKRNLLWTLAALPLALAAGDDNFALTVQGIFAGLDGVALTDRNRTVVVRLYDTESSTNCLWARAFAVSVATNGLFTTTLTDRDGSPPDDGRGSCATLLEAVLAASNHVAWAGFEDTRTAGELKPRVRLSRVPRAQRAFRACRPSGDFSVAGKLRASELLSGDATVQGDVRTPSVRVLETLTAGRTLNVDSLAADGPVSFGGVLRADRSVAVGGALTVMAGRLTAARATARTLQVGTCSLTNAAKVTIGGAPADFPVGAITMWSGSQASIPYGWHVCNGNEGTVDLRERFVVGVGSKRSLNDKGGSATVALTTEQMPIHEHTMVARNFGYDAHHDDKEEVLATKWLGRTGTRKTGNAGSGEAHENRPPYYALYFIQRIK